MHMKYAKFDCKDVEETKFSNKYFNNEDFKGNISLLTFVKSNRKEKIVDGTNIEYAMSGDKWLEIYPENGDYAIICSYNKNNNIRAWYFDIANKVDITEDGIPYTEDLYLDVLIKSNGKIDILDEDELLEAYEQDDINKEQFEKAYKVKDYIINQYADNLKQLNNFTDKYLKLIESKN